MARDHYLAKTYLKHFAGSDGMLRVYRKSDVLELQDEHIDVAIRIGQLPASSRRARRIGTIRRIVCASPDYLSRHGEPRILADLADHSVVSFHGFDPPGNWIFATSDGTVTVPIRSRIMFDTNRIRIDAGIAGIGLIRVFSYHVRPAFRAGMLREVLSDFAPPSVPVHILHGTDDMVPLKVRAFYRLLRAAPTSTLTR